MSPQSIRSSRRALARVGGRGFPLLLLVALAAACATPRAAPPRREEFPLDPREELSGPFSDELDQAAAALLAGQGDRAVKAFSEVRKKQKSLAAEIGWIEAEVVAGDPREAAGACASALSSGEPTLPLLVGCGEAKARSGSAVDALDLYRRAATRAGGRQGIARRASELTDLARDELVREARAAAAAKKWKEARGEIARALALAPESGTVRIAAGEVESAAGNSERAFEHFREALRLEPGNRALREKVAELAVEAGEDGLAISLFDELARENPAYRERAEQARLSFRVANWPAAERDAAESDRVTRAGAATLVWWMFPEVREAKVSTSVIASDVVGRRDSRALARALALGLLEADRETHRASPDAFLTLTAASRLSLRLIALLDRSSRELPCFGNARAVRSGSEAVRLAQTCGLFAEDESSPVSGPALTRALDRIRALVSSDAKAERE